MEKILAIEQHLANNPTVDSITNTNASTINWLKIMGILSNSRLCKKCGKNMNIWQKKLIVKNGGVQTVT